MIVTIDGPAGTGKSTVARRLSDVLGFQYLDTGAMYRMIALKTVVSAGIDPADHDTIIRMANSTTMDLKLGRYFLDGVEVGGELRSSEVTLAASLVAQIPEIRHLLVERQRTIAASRNIVCEGRDQGTVAFPHAEWKFFLTAQPEVRARRRMNEMIAKGKIVDFKELLAEQTARDQRDEERVIAPLRPADDAVIVDTTDLSVDDVVEQLRRRVVGELSPSKEV